jgi:hypothetical protein
MLTVNCKVMNRQTDKAFDLYLQQVKKLNNINEQQNNDSEEISESLL